MVMTFNGDKTLYSEAIKTLIASKFDKLSKFCKKGGETSIYLSKSGALYEMTAKLKLSHKKEEYVAVAKDDDLYACIDPCIDRIKSQIIKNKFNKQDERKVRASREMKRLEM